MRILFQGDSITDGNRGRNEDPNHILGHGYVFNIASFLGALYPQKFEFINRGVSGDFITRLLARWHNEAVAFSPDIVSIMVGVNDSHNMIAPERYEEVYHMLINDIPQAKFILMEPFRYRHTQDDETWEKIENNIRAYQQIVRKAAAEHNAVFVPLQEVFDNAQQKAPLDYWIWDGVHPTYSGHYLITQAWLEAAKELLF